MRLRPRDHCMCVTAQMFGHSITPGELCSSRLQPNSRAPQGGTYHVSFLPARLCWAAVQLGRTRQGPAHKAHTNSSLSSSAGLPWGTAAKVEWNPTAILSSDTALLFPPTSSSICHRRPCSKNRQRQDASHRMKWNCHSPQRHGAEIKHFPNSKGDKCDMLSYSLDSFYNTKALTNLFTLSLEDTGTPTHVTVLHSMMLRAFWKKCTWGRSTSLADPVIQLIIKKN